MGEQMLITCHRQIEERVEPVQPTADEQRQKAVEKLRQFCLGKTLGGISLKDLRNQGRWRQSSTMARR